MYRTFESMNLDKDWYDYVNQHNFDDLALQVFHYQAQNNDLYRQFCQLVRPNFLSISKIEDIPFLPIHFFKTHSVTTTTFEAQAIFESSGTTQTVQSKHFIKSTDLYLDTCTKGFETYFGSIEQKPILGLLPSYLERNNSSLVYMVQHFIERSKHQDSGFYLYDFEKLANKIKQLEAQAQPYFLIGVTFALLDYAEAFPQPLQYASILETGGMKGRKEEWTRTQVHNFLKKQFTQEQIFSEYGMTELLSQGYLIKEERFSPIATLQARIRDVNDPLAHQATGKGAINIIDLSNIYSCSFIATEDLGIVYADGSFEILGRMDQSALRGCSLMAL